MATLDWSVFETDVEKIASGQLRSAVPIHNCFDALKAAVVELNESLPLFSEDEEVGQGTKVLLWTDSDETTWTMATVDDVIECSDAIVAGILDAVIAPNTGITATNSGGSVAMNTTKYATTSVPYTSTSGEALVVRVWGGILTDGDTNTVNSRVSLGLEVSTNGGSSWTDVGYDSTAAAPGKGVWYNLNLNATIFTVEGTSYLFRAAVKPISDAASGWQAKVTSVLAVGM